MKADPRTTIGLRPAASCGRAILLTSMLAGGACGGGAPAAPDGPRAGEAIPAVRLDEPGVVGSASGGAQSAPEAAPPRARSLGVSGRVGGRDVRVASAFLLTPDVEGPVELHAYEATVSKQAACPAGLMEEPAGMLLRVVLPDTRHGDDPALVTWATDDGAIAVRAAKVEVARVGRQGGATLVSISLRGDGGDRLEGAILAHVCPDDREAP